MPKVSVIIPVYNASKYLNQCISSIINQTLQDIEILAVNDGSTDCSLDILDMLSHRYKGKLKVMDKENGGAGSARNLGLEYANGEFIKFVDADDYLNVDILEKMYTVAKENNMSLVRGNYEMILGPFKMQDKCSWSNIDRNQIIDVRKNKGYVVSETPGIGNKLISRDLLGDLRFPERTKWEDLAIMPVVIASSEKLFHFDEPVYNYRVNMNTTIKDFIGKIPDILDIIKSVESVEEQMKLRGLADEYQVQIENIYVLHTLFRVENAICWMNLSHFKKKIVVSSLLGILDSKYSDWQERSVVAEYRSRNKLFDYDMQRLDQFVCDDYRNVDREIAEKNIAKVFSLFDK